MKDEIKKLLEKAILGLKGELGADFAMPEINLERPKDEQFGDWTTNVAMVLGKSLKKNPLEVAEGIATSLNAPRNDSTIFEKVEAVKPGYINFYLAPKYFQEKVAEINKLENNFGNSEIGKGVKVNNEFISANPTGPLHLGNGRGGFCGDAITKVLRKSGFEVVSEYYLNDAGEQTLNLAHSFKKDDQATYSGEYIDELRGKYEVLIASSVQASAAPLSAAVTDDYIKPAIKKMQIHFDVWISEKKDLIDGGYIDRAIEMLELKKLTFEKEGAVWLKTTEFGDDKDRVLIKKDGQKTYFASDCGYILNKMERGFDNLIEIWGADHHGYIERFKAAAKALGFKGELKFVIVQLVQLIKDGKEVRMSKRAGNVVLIDDLIDEVGLDVARFFFLMYSPDTHMNFDLGLAKEQSQKNPVFYVQYAHARICSILSKAQMTDDVKLESLTHEKEISLIRELDKFPGLVAELAESYEVHKLPHYVLKLADKFHSFYAACQVIDEKNPELTSARLELINAVRIVLAETLRIIGVGAPQKM